MRARSWPNTDFNSRLLRIGLAGPHFGDETLAPSYQKKVVNEQHLSQETSVEPLSAAALSATGKEGNSKSKSGQVSSVLSVAHINRLYPKIFGNEQQLPKEASVNFPNVAASSVTEKAGTPKLTTGPSPPAVVVSLGPSTNGQLIEIVSDLLVFGHDSPS